MSSASPAYTAHARPSVWLSDAKLSQGIPWFRAVLDAMLISLGAYLFLTCLLQLSDPKFSDWTLCFFYAGMATMACTGLLIALKTSYSNRIKDRRPVLACLSIILLLFAALSMTSLLVGSPEYTKVVTLFCCAIAAWVLICIALISIEKRLAQSPITKHLITETTVGLKQTAFRLWQGIFTCLAALTSVSILIVSLYQISQGTFFDKATLEYGRSLNSTESASMLLLSAFVIMLWLGVGVTSANNLTKLHQSKDHTFNLLGAPWVGYWVISSLALVVNMIFFAVLTNCFELGAEGLPWMVVTTVVSSFVACRYGLDALNKDMNLATP